jgi:hypothetical protein
VNYAVDTTMHVPVMIVNEPRGDGRYRVNPDPLCMSSFFATAEELRDLCDDVPESAKAPEPPDTVTVEGLPRAFVEWMAKAMFSMDADRAAASEACRAALDAEGER